MLAYIIIISLASKRRLRGLRFGFLKHILLSSIENLRERAEFCIGRYFQLELVQYGPS